MGRPVNCKRGSFVLQPWKYDAVFVVRKQVQLQLPVRVGSQVVALSLWLVLGGMRRVCESARR